MHRSPFALLSLIVVPSVDQFAVAEQPKPIERSKRDAAGAQFDAHRRAGGDHVGMAQTASRSQRTRALYMGAQVSLKCVR